MKKYKLSKYNVFVDKDPKGFIYNLLSNELFSFKHELFNYLKNSEGTVDESTLKPELINSLYNSNIILDETENEINMLHYDYHKDKYDDSFISLVIYATLKCNFNCHYCYEKHKNTSMSDEKFDILKQFLIKESATRKFIATRWSGGEPLLVWKKIYNTSLEIIDACKKNNCNYISSIVCNGYLLTETILDEMLSVHINSIQITLDGNPENHNRVRFLKDGTGTFDRILQSIEMASKRMKVILRLNIDKNNIHQFDELFEILSKSKINKSNVRIFCKPVVCTIARIPENPLFSHEEFYSVEKKLIESATKNDLIYSFHWGVKSRKTRCVYHTLTGFLADPELNLFRCPIYIGGDLEHKVGHIDNQGLHITNREEYLKTLSYSPFDLQECKECKVLPICNGKCPVLWEISGRKKEEGCIPDKYSFEKKLKYAIENERQLEALRNSTIN